MIYIAGGHSNDLKKDTGAFAWYNGKPLREGVLAAEFAEALVNRLKYYGVQSKLDAKTNILLETVSILKRLVGGKDYVIEYHFNAANGKVKGTESFIPKDFTDVELSLAISISCATNKALSTPLRGALGVKNETESNRKTLGLMRLNCQTVLHEIEFIDNPQAMKSYFDNFEKLVDLHAQAIKSLCK